MVIALSKCYISGNMHTRNTASSTRTGKRLNRELSIIGGLLQKNQSTLIIEHYLNLHIFSFVDVLKSLLYTMRN